MYVKLQKAWPSVEEEVDKMDNLTKFEWKTLQVGSPLYEMAQEALKYGSRALSLETFARETIGNCVNCLFFILEMYLVSASTSLEPAMRPDSYLMLCIFLH
jgi:hypothetical protein